MVLKSGLFVNLIIYTMLSIVTYLIYDFYSDPYIDTSVILLLGLVDFLVVVLLVNQFNFNRKNIVLTSLYDNKTKLYNRQYFLAELTTTYERAIRYDFPLSILLISIENLDEFNKKEKELVLKEIGKFMLKHSRQSDILCRYDENKIVLLLPMTDYLHASIAKDRFQKGLLSINFNIEKQPIFQFKAVQNSTDENSDEFLQRVFI